MSEISVININNKAYQVKDTQARTQLQAVEEQVENAVDKTATEEQNIASPLTVAKYIVIGNAKITDDGTNVTFE